MQIFVVVTQYLRRRIPPFEILRAVHAYGVGAEIHLTTLHFQQDRADGRILVVEILPIHVGSREVVRVQGAETLIVRMTENDIEDEHLGL